MGARISLAAAVNEEAKTGRKRKKREGGKRKGRRGREGRRLGSYY